MASVSRMHELIAAEPNVMGTYKAMREETLKVFDKPENFIATTTIKTHFDDSQSHLDTSESKEMVTTVGARIRYLLENSFTRYVDLELQKDKTNQLAVADISINGTVLAEKVPATMLLSLEKDLKDLREVLTRAPTLPAGITWVADEGTGTYVTREPQVSFSTKRVTKPVVLVQATDHFPAQVEKIQEDVPVAKITKTTWSGMTTSTQKAELLGRVDALLIAVKKARQRANNQETDKSKIGRTLANFIVSGPSSAEAD